MECDKPKLNLNGHDGHLSEVEGEPLPDHVPSLWQTFASTSSRYPDNIAIACLQQPPDLYQIVSRSPPGSREYQEKPWLRWTYRSLLTAIRRLQGALEERGLRQGAPLFTFLHAGVEFPLCLWMSYAKRCCFAPLHPKNLTNLPEVAHMMDSVLSVAADEKPFIIAGSEAIARQIERLPIARASVKILLGDAPVDGWERLDDLMRARAAHDGHEVALEEGPGPDDAGPSADNIVFFTSGTTALPKGCLWKHPAGALYLQQRLRRAGHITPESRVCVPIPNNHGAAWYWSTPTLCQGGTVVYPGPSVDPSAVIRAMHLERCTDAIVVPTMVHPLAVARSSLGVALHELHCVSMAGSPCTPAHVGEVMRELGARSIENAWGMTENVLLPSGAYHDPKVLFQGSHVSVGRVPDGLRLKICPPGGYAPVPRGTPGELHFSSRILTHEYIGVESPDYYDMDGVRWFKTGDQARIDGDGLVFVVGRYKDMIIRGAENIAPAAIEAIIAAEERLGSLDIQVVGAPDAVADEVPVVVSREPLAPRTFELLRETVATRMGPQYAPVEVFTLRDLGLDEWPKTMIGKLQKGQIAARVKQHVKQRETSSGREGRVGLGTTVRQIWARSLGVDADMLAVDRPIGEFADSITIMRVRDRIARETGRVLSLDSLAEAGTIRRQSELLLDQEGQKSVQGVVNEIPEAGENPHDAQAGGLLRAEDIVHVNEVFEATKKAVLDTIKPHGLDWGDVVEVTPVYDFLEVSSRSDAIDSWSPKWALVCHPSLSVEQVSAAVRTSISKHPILNSFYVRQSDSMALYVILRQKQTLLDNMIVNRGKLQSEDDLATALREIMEPDPTKVPGPLAHFSVFTIEETRSVGVVMKLNHLVCDAASSQMFLDDLDQCLGGREPRPHHTPYKTWSDAYHRHRRSPEARAAVAWHLDRLRDLHLHRGALWPRPDAARRHRDADAHAHAFDCPGLQALLRSRAGAGPGAPQQQQQQQQRISAPVVAKTAYALATAGAAGGARAPPADVVVLFASNEAARGGADVAGPCYAKAANLVRVRPGEAVAALLLRAQAEQDGQTRHAAAPWREVLAGLGRAAADVLVDMNWCSTFNWVPHPGAGAGAGGGGGGGGSNVRVAGFCVRLYNGLTTTCALEGGAGGGGERVLMELRGTGLDPEGMAGFAARFERVMRWICREENWEASVGRALEECL